MKIGTYKNALKLIEEFEKIVIFHHIRPDGDCLGSQFGLKELIKFNYPTKDVRTIGDSKNCFKNFLTFDFDQIFSDKELKESLAIVVDANFKDRIEKREVLDKNLFKKVLRIDHHPNDDDLNNVTRWVESDRIAAAEMVAELAYQAKWKINQKAANYIFLGMVTDSGRFMFSNTSARTHELASYLYKNNLDAEKIFQGLAQTSLNDLKLQSILMKNLQTKDGVAFTFIDYKTIKKLNLDPNEAVRVNLIGNLENYPIWVQFVEEENSKIRVEFRSNGPIVRNVAIKWNGGGHERASGAMINSFEQMNDVIDDCILEVKKYLNHK